MLADHPAAEPAPFVLAVVAFVEAPEVAWEQLLEEPASGTGLAEQG